MQTAYTVLILLMLVSVSRLVGRVIPLPLPLPLVQTAAVGVLGHRCPQGCSRRTAAL